MARRRAFFCEMGDAAAAEASARVRTAAPRTMIVVIRRVPVGAFTASVPFARASNGRRTFAEVSSRASIVFEPEGPFPVLGAALQAQWGSEKRPPIQAPEMEP